MPASGRETMSAGAFWLRHQRPHGRHAAASPSCKALATCIRRNDVPWLEQFLPNTACSRTASRLRLLGPRIGHSTACASGLIEVLTAMRAIQDGQCDIAPAGSAEAIDALFAAGFYQMRVLAHHDDPQQACRPFDMDRQGFVMGEGAAMFVLERLSHAQARGARIYAEIVCGKLAATAHHVTSLDMESDCLAHLITKRCARAASLRTTSATSTLTARALGRTTWPKRRAIRTAMGTRRPATVRQRQQIDSRPLDQCRWHRRIGNHHAGHARRIRAAHAQSHQSRSPVRSRLHSPGRPQEPGRHCAQAFRGLRRHAGRGGATALGRCRKPNGLGPPRGLSLNTASSSPDDISIQ